MLSQLRRYKVRTEDWDEFVALFFEHIVPAREALGFRVDGVWGDRESGTFAWVVSHEAPGGWEAGDRAYYDSPERRSVPRGLPTERYTTMNSETKTNSSAPVLMKRESPERTMSMAAAAFATRFFTAGLTGTALPASRGRAS